MVHFHDTLGALPSGMHVIEDPASGMSGVIALHSTALGPAAGGCRLWDYENQADLATDAVRLAQGMSFKNAMAGLPFGGGKAVLQRPKGDFDRKALFRSFAEAVEALNGQYITAEDVGTTVADMSVVRQHTRYVAGLEPAPGMAGGDPSPWTARGVFEAMKVAAQKALGTDLKGLTVAVQGTGNVGAALCAMLADAGVRLIIADVETRRLRVLAAIHDARIVEVDEILGVEADILAPCALGGVFDAQSIPQIKAQLICGGANNQLATPEDGMRLMERGITYAPDYIVNAGGIINVAAEYLGESSAEVESRVQHVAERLGVVLETARLSGQPTNLVADQMARRIIADAAKKAA